MKSLIAIAFAVGLVVATPTIVRADDGASTRASDTDLSSPGGVDRFFSRLELEGGSGS